jgi:hypothetical protein
VWNKDWHFDFSVFLAILIYFLFFSFSFRSDFPFSRIIECQTLVVDKAKLKAWDREFVTNLRLFFDLIFVK